MRIIAGTFRSRRIRTLPGRHLRPISDRLRESLFNILQRRVPGSVFLDAYAGSGAVGIEALSRGAHKVFFIEKHPRALALIRENLAGLGIEEAFEVLAEDVGAGLRGLARQGIETDICFLGPPYAETEEYERTLNLLGELKIVGEGGLVIAQHATRHRLGESYGRLRRTRLVRVGSNALSFYEPG